MDRDGPTLPGHDVHLYAGRVMLYSCFNPEVGLYDYFEDDAQRAINADLPVPKLPPIAGKVGVPAIDAGRPLPSGAKPAGKGWHAKGVVVQCGRGSRVVNGGLGDFMISDTARTALVIGGALLVLMWASDVPGSWWRWSPKTPLRRTR